MKTPPVKVELAKLLKAFAKQPPAIQAGIWIFGSVASLAIAYLIFSLAYLGRVYPKVSVGGVSFGGLTVEQAQDRLDQTISANSEPITLRFEDKTQILTQDEINWQYDSNATARRIFNVGRNPSSKMAGFWQQLASVFSRQQVYPVVTYDGQALEAAVAGFADTVDQPAVAASAVFDGAKLVMTKEAVGQIVNRLDVMEDIVRAWGEFTGSEILVQSYFDAPTVLLGDETELQVQAELLATRKLRLAWPGGTRQLSTGDIKKLIGFTGGEDLSDGQQRLSAAFTIDQAKVYLEGLADTVDQPAVEPRLIIVNGVLAIAAPAKAGRVIDLTLSAEAIVLAMVSGEESPLVTLTIKDQKPLITENNLNELGIKERIGYGETSFAGSPANRIHNIKNGVSLLQSALVAPSQEFSTVATLGAVDNSTGFLPELVIKDNRTTPEFGGGLCQISTTLFRSVLNAGLPITDRRNHSYRVGYYEPPIGLDATIYLPKPDFKFFNDTPGHILVQGKVVANKVIFELWGTSDGRVSVVSDPQIISTTPVGEPIYADTDTLPRGEVKQIEKAHDGAVAVAYYTVTRNGETINQQTFRSVYKAWPARFLVGTAEPPPAPVP